MSESVCAFRNSEQTSYEQRVENVKSSEIRKASDGKLISTTLFDVRQELCLSSVDLIGL
jgi:hypothetical protein